MRHLNTVRQLRGQTAPGLRRNLRDAKRKIADQESVITDLTKANKMLAHRLNAASMRPIPVSTGFTDHILEGFADAIGRAMADKAVEANPELVKGMAVRLGQYVGMYMAGQMNMRIEPESEIIYEYQELLNGRDFRLSFTMDGIRINYQDDLRRVQCMRANYEEPKRVQRPVPVTQADVVNALAR